MMKVQVNTHHAFRDQRNDTVKENYFCEAYRLNFIYLKFILILRQKDSIFYNKGEKTFS